MLLQILCILAYKDVYDNIVCPGKLLWCFSSMVTYFGVFPDSWRERIVIPLHKKGDKNDVNNYRGIT